MKNSEIDKSQVALRFAQAGQSYTEHAIVQKQIARRLFDLIQHYAAKMQFERVFEIGCGSGNLSHLLLKDFQISHYLLNDLYPEVQQHFQGYSNIDWLLGDIERLNFPDALELIVSTSALQWMTDLDAVFHKANDSLLAQGLFCFSTFGERNLQEIKILTGQGLAYLKLDQLREKLQNQGFDVLHLSEQIEYLDFATPKQVLQHLKATGVTATASNFRWTKHSLERFYQDYQQFSQQDASGLIHYRLSYHPIYCIARRMP